MMAQSKVKPMTLYFGIQYSVIIQRSNARKERRYTLGSAHKLEVGDIYLLVSTISTTYYLLAKVQMRSHTMIQTIVRSNYQGTHAILCIRLFILDVIRMSCAISQ